MLFLMKSHHVSSIHSQPDTMKDDLKDMTEYVTETLQWAMGRMTDLTIEDRCDDALAIGAEFINWANDSDKEIICCSVQED